MRKVNYPNGKILWDGKTLFYINGKIAWQSNMGYYPNGSVVCAGFQGFYKNGDKAWDGNKGYDEDGLFMTNFGVALRLDRLLVLLISKTAIEIDVLGELRFTIKENKSIPNS